MPCTRRSLWITGLASMLASSVHAAWPERSIQLVVPFPAGGPADALGRGLAQGLGRELGVNVLVQNLPGATGQRGTVQVARAAADGLTLLLGTNATHAIAPSLFPKLPYQPERDFVTIGQVSTTRLLLVAHPSLPARSLAELIKLARQSATPLACGSFGLGSGGHLVIETLRRHGNLPLNHVPYQGIAPMLTDLLGGQIPLAMSDVAGAMAMLQAGRLVPLVVTGRSRHPALPAVGTLAEAGIAFPAESWYAMFAPAQLPASTLARLDTALRATLAQPDMADSLRALALDASTLDREAFDRAWREDIAVWRQIITDTGVSLE